MSRKNNALFIYRINICFKNGAQIVRVDLAQDAGLSLSPEVDIGQIEGAFVMGTKGVRTWF